MESQPEKLHQKFLDLASKSTEEQTQFFLKSFIFALGPSWGEVVTLSDAFREHACNNTDSSAETLNQIQAADFLQKHGKTRTGLERRHEIEEFDIDNDGKICFLEYLIMHYKRLILTEYFARYDISPPPEMDLSEDCVGLVGVVDFVVEELFSMPQGLSPQLEFMLDNFLTDKKKREERVAELKAKALSKSGVKGMAAQRELEILRHADQTELNKIELTLNAARRRTARQSGEAALSLAMEEKAKGLEADRAERRGRLRQRAAKFEGVRKGSPEHTTGRGCPGMTPTTLGSSKIL